MKNNQSRLAIVVFWLLLRTFSVAFAQGAEIPAVPKLRLGNDVRPTAYAAELVVIPEQSNFTGQISIELNFGQQTSFFWLHGHGLTVTNAYLEQRGFRIPARPVIGGEEFLGFDLPQPASAGKARLLVGYTGEIPDKEIAGLFRRQEDGRWYAATQLESTWARRVFPCFDEPAFKVPWRLALHVKKEQVAVSNAPLLSETDEPGGMKCVHFGETHPLPSYLVAVAVGPFDVLDLGKVGRNHTPVRIFTAKGKTNEAAFASAAVPELLRRLEDYYDLPYPYPKLDHLAVPQFEGAMENAGLIIHDENLLLSPPDRETIPFRRNCANVCTHEMAHQWFGDLVTMAWWDDIWLNEAFATWISPKIVDNWKPEWRMGLDQLLATFGAVGADSLTTARCIRQPIQSAPDIDNAFDGITYDKGAAVLGMFESGIGPESFRKAIRAYLQSHAWKTATTADFLALLNKQTGKDIAASFSTFLDQSGVPLVSAELSGSSDGVSSIRLSQKRYLPVGSSGDVHREWKIPLRLRYQGAANEEQLGLSFTNQQESVNLKTGPTGQQWVLLNQGAAGYYVAAYRGELLTNLLHGGTAKFSAAERMDTAHSISAAVRSADVPLGEALSLAPTLLLDPERRVVTMAAGFMNVRDRVPEELRSNYQRFIRKTLEPLIHGASWESPNKETDDQRLQRLALLSLAADAGEDTRLIDDAKRLALAWVKDRKAVPADEANTVLGVAGRYADADLFDTLLAEAKKTQEPSDRQHLIWALGSCRDVGLARRALNALSNREFEPLDSLRLLFALSGHIETRALTYDYLKEHYSAVTAVLPADAVFSYLPNLAQGFDTAERQADAEAFFKDKDVKLTGGPRIIAQVLESIHLNLAFKEAQMPSLIEFLKGQ
jgi:alanyl aminopeptidase